MSEDTALPQFGDEDPAADSNGALEFDFYAISECLMDLNAGCP